MTPKTYAKITFFSEDFNGNWSTITPPAGWTIFNDSLGSQSWSRDSAGLHWSDNYSGYAEMSYEIKCITGHQELDSLISPVINCYRYRDVVLRCSTNFQDNNGEYSAKIIGSIDGGQTYPYIIRNYYGEYFRVPKLETLDLDWAYEKENIRIAFVFSGNVLNINYWCIDNLSLTGTYVYNTDASCTEILKPFAIQSPGLCSVQIRVVNLGKLDLSNFNVRCSVIDPIGTPVHTANTTVITLQSRETTDIFLSPAWSIPDSPPFKYYIEAWCEVSGDENIANDTTKKDSVTIAWTENLQYCEDVPNAGENYPIGEQGWGVKFTPDFYPAQIQRINCYLGTSKSEINYRYKIRIVDDDGIDSSPGTTLYETSIINGSSGWNSTNYIFYQDTIAISSGSIYIFYIQVDDVPVTPLLFHDGSRTASAVYYKYSDSSYIRDEPDGDWLLHLFVQSSLVERKDHDLRTVFISNPSNEFVHRPDNYQPKIRARIENLGLSTESDFAVSCTVRYYDVHSPLEPRYYDVETIPYLGAGQGTYVEFSKPWDLNYDEPDSIIVQTHLSSDPNPSNDRKAKFVNDIIANFSGQESDSAYAFYDSDSTDDLTYSWIDTSGAYLVTDCGSDLITALPPLPFAIPYYDTSYNTIYVSTNGFITFINCQSSPGVNCTIPSTQEPNCALYPFWDDLYLLNDRSAKIYYKFIGTQPHRAIVITWLNVAHKNTSGLQRLTFQAILYEDGNIVFQYKDVNCGAQWANLGKSATIGIESPQGNRGLLYLFGSESNIINWPENKLSPQRAIKFYRPTLDVGIRTIVDPKDTVIPSPITPQVWIKNFGTVTADTVRVFLSISPAYDTFEIVRYLMSGESTLVKLANWDARTGRHTVVCSTQFTNDQHRFNNIVRDSVLVSMWVMKPSIPSGPRVTTVKNGALTYSPVFNKIYALKGGNCNEFWCYDIANNSWDSLPRMPKAPSNKMPKAGCALTNAGLNIYALKGSGMGDFYSYDILNRTWTPLAPAQDSYYAGRKKPKDGAGIVYSNYDGMIYAIFGNNTNDLARYNPGSNTWSHVKETPDVIRDGGSMTQYHDILYLFQGNNHRDIWRYSIIGDSWLVTRCTIPGIKKQNLVKSGAISTCDTTLGIIYFFIGGNQQSLWKYDINTNSFYALTAIPGKKKIKKGASMVSVPLDLIYSFKSGSTNEFWAYAFWGDTMSKGNWNLLSNEMRTEQINNQEKKEILYCHTISSLSTPFVINYALECKSRVKINIYSLEGQLINNLCDEQQCVGNHQIYWNGVNASGQKVRGIYFIRGIVGNKQVFKKIIRI
jgi:hypothetical protein